MNKMGEDTAAESERTNCPYCSKDFDSEQKRGVHIAEEHTDSDRRIPKKTKNRNKQPEQLTDKWRQRNPTG